MGLPPLGGRPHLQLPQHAGLRSSAEDAAAAAEREASRRIEQTEKSVEDAQRAAETQIDDIRDTYEKRESDQSVRQDELVEKQRLKGYEDLRDLQRTQQAELNRVRREGERDLATLTNYYRDTTYSTERQGSDRLSELAKQQARSMHYEETARGSDLELAKDQHRKQFEETTHENEIKLQNLQEGARNEYDRMRANTVEAGQKAEENFNEKFAHKVKEQNEVLSDLDYRTSRAIENVRRDSSHKLAAYSERQNDPFYRLLDLDAQLHDDGDSYVLTATIPEHEQGHVSVAVKGSQLVLTGSRRNEEKLELAPGRSQGTNSFQSFLETFPIAWPVDEKRMTRTFEGDQLTVRVPKKSEFAYQSPVKPPPPRARVERPKFPDNLPLAKTDGQATTPMDPTPGRKPRPGSGTLS